MLADDALRNVPVTGLSRTSPMVTATGSCGWRLQMVRRSVLRESMEQR